MQTRGSHLSTLTCRELYYQIFCADWRLHFYPWELEWWLPTSPSGQTNSPDAQMPTYSWCFVPPQKNAVIYLTRQLLGQMIWNCKPAMTCLLKNKVKSGQAVSITNACWAFTYCLGPKCLPHFSLWHQLWKSTNYISHTPLCLTSCKVLQMVDHWKAGGKEKNLAPDPVSTNPTEEESCGSSLPFSLDLSDQSCRALQRYHCQPFPLSWLKYQSTHLPQGCEHHMCRAPPFSYWVAEMSPLSLGPPA